MTDHRQFAIDRIMEILTPEFKEHNIDKDTFERFLGTINAEVLLEDLEAYLTLDSKSECISMYYNWLKIDLVTRTTPTGNNFLINLIK